jgi:hypothetical protein
MNQQTPGGRERGLRRAGLITAMLAVAGVVGSGMVAVVAHADTVAKSTSTTGSTSTTDSTSTTGGTSTTTTPSVSAGSGLVPQAQSAGS